MKNAQEIIKKLHKKYKGLCDSLEITEETEKDMVLKSSIDPKLSIHCYSNGLFPERLIYFYDGKKISENSRKDQKNLSTNILNKSEALLRKHLNTNFKDIYALKKKILKDGGINASNLTILKYTYHKDYRAVHRESVSTTIHLKNNMSFLIKKYYPSNEIEVIFKKDSREIFTSGNFIIKENKFNNKSGNNLKHLIDMYLNYQEDFKDNPSENPIKIEISKSSFKNILNHPVELFNEKALIFTNLKDYDISNNNLNDLATNTGLMKRRIQDMKQYLLEMNKIINQIENDFIKERLNENYKKCEEILKYQIKKQKEIEELYIDQNIEQMSEFLDQEILVVI
jgi:hypothetical protein